MVHIMSEYRYASGIMDANNFFSIFISKKKIYGYLINVVSSFICVHVFLNCSLNAKKLFMQRAVYSDLTCGGYLSSMIVGMSYSSDNPSISDCNVKS